MTTTTQFRSSRKRCFKCGKRKLRTSFYRHPMMDDGLLGKCKECTKADVTANRRKRYDYYSEYDRARNVQPDRKQRRRDRQVVERARWPGRYAARMALSNAIRDGRIVPRPCEDCGATENVHGHHDDYRRPLSVRWLCAKHHMRWHAQNRKAS